MQQKWSWRAKCLPAVQEAPLYIGHLPAAQGDRAVPVHHSELVYHKFQIPSNGRITNYYMHVIKTVK